MLEIMENDIRAYNLLHDSFNKGMWPFAPSSGPCNRRRVFPMLFARCTNGACLTGMPLFSFRVAGVSLYGYAVVNAIVTVVMVRLVAIEGWF